MTKKRVKKSKEDFYYVLECGSLNNWYVPFNNEGDKLLYGPNQLEEARAYVTAQRYSCGNAKCTCILHDEDYQADTWRIAKYQRIGVVKEDTDE